MTAVFMKLSPSHRPSHSSPSKPAQNGTEASGESAISADEVVVEKSASAPCRPSIIRMGSDPGASLRRSSIAGEVSTLHPVLSSIGCLLIGDVDFSHPVTHQIIFHRLSLFDLTDAESLAAQKLQKKIMRRSLKVKTGAVLMSAPSKRLTGDGLDTGPLMLPAGRVIGLRGGQRNLADSRRESATEKLSELAFLQLLSGAFKPSRGTATCTRRSELVGQSPVLFTGSLMDNLTYNCRSVQGGYPHRRVPSRVDSPPVGSNREGSRRQSHSYVESPEIFFDNTEAPTPAADRFIWDLCKKMNISETLIGHTYKPGGEWGELRLNSAMQQLSIVDMQDASKIELVRALLAQPDALLVHRVCDGWDVSEQQRLVSVLQDYVVGTLDGYTGAGRTVLLCTNDLGLSLAFHSDDLILTLESKTRATLTTMEHSGLDNYRRTACQMWMDGRKGRHDILAPAGAALYREDSGSAVSPDASSGSSSQGASKYTSSKFAPSPAPQKKASKPSILSIMSTSASADLGDAASELTPLSVTIEQASASCISTASAASTASVEEPPPTVLGRLGNSVRSLLSPRADADAVPVDLPSTPPGPPLA